MECYLFLKYHYQDKTGQKLVQKWLQFKITCVVYYSQQYLLQRRNSPNQLILENKESPAVINTSEIKEKSVKTPI